ncbi:hypothetical protein L7F22_018762 [Adiantum nelumboides]|nr:hypothetical protein [Adiantum nelumboides]
MKHSLLLLLLCIVACRECYGFFEDDSARVAEDFFSVLNEARAQGNGKDWSPYDAASDWANEKRWYSYWSNSCLFYDACGHYTQIVWRDSRYVGCAQVTCNDGNIFMTCNYYPPGNYIGQRPY